MAADGYIRIDTKINQQGAKSGLAALVSSLKGFAAAAAVALSVKKIIDFGKACVAVASNLAEVQNVVDVTFGAAAQSINDFAKSAATQFGLSELAAKQYAGTMGAMFKSMGFATGAAADMSTQMAALAGDMASFYNLKTDEAFEKLRSGISGETEPLKALGINLSEANLEAFALANGIKTGYSKMSEQNKALIRYNYILKATSDAQGDFTRTSGGWANQLRIAQLQLDSIKASLGQGFIAVLTPVLQLINRILSALNGAASVFAAFMAKVTGTAQTATTAAAGVGVAADATDNLADSATAAGEAAKEAQRGLQGFDELNRLQADSGGAGAGAGGGAAMGTATYAGEGTPTVSPVVDEVAKRVQEEVNRLTTEYADNIEKVKASWEQLKGTVMDFWERFKQQVGETDLLGALFDLGTSAAYAFLEVVNIVAKVLGDLIIAFNVPATVESVIRLLADAFQAVGDVVAAITPGVVNFVDTALVPIAEWIGEKLRDAFAFLGEQLTKIGDWFTARKDVFTALGQSLGDAAAAVWDFIEPMLDGIWETFKDVVSGIVDGLLAFSDWCLEHQETVSNLAVLIGSVVAAFQIYHAVIAVGKGLYTALTVGAAALGGALTFLTSPIGLVVIGIAAVIAIIVICIKYWDEIKMVVQIVADYWREKLDTTWAAITKAVKDTWGKIETFFKDLFDRLKAFFAKWGIYILIAVAPWLGLPLIIIRNWDVIKKFFTDLFDNIKKKTRELGENIKTTWSGIYNAIKEKAIDPIKNAFSSLKDAVTSTWDKMWSGIKGVINKIVGGVEGFVNGIIKGINRLIDGINVLLGTGLSALGISPLSPIQTVSIPRLAEGAVIPPNREFMAVLGDQRSGTNIETPLDTMVEAFRAALREGGNTSNGTPVIVFKGELAALGKVLSPYITMAQNEANRAAGRTLQNA